MSRVMYHYTSAAGYAGILKTKSIKPSLRANNPRDARFGDGQYVSDIIPGTKRPGQLSMIFFGIPRAGKRFSPHININVERLQSQTEFTSKEISKDDFERQWIAATAKR